MQHSKAYHNCMLFSIQNSNAVKTAGHNISGEHINSPNPTTSYIQKATVKSNAIFDTIALVKLYM